MRSFPSLLAILAIIGFADGPAAPPPKIPGATPHLYKQTATRPLYLYVLRPPASFAGPRPAIIFFFGGGWTGGTTDQFDDQAQHFASRGFITVLADYRIRQRDQSTPFDSVCDARSAMRWLRSHAAELGVDSRKIAASGGSAGGHLAGATAILTDVNEASDDLGVSPAPAALVLFNPVLDTTERGYGAATIGPRAEELSLTHHIRKGLPPILILHGTNDHTVPFQNAIDFAGRVKSVGGDCELVPFEGADHGFFNSPSFRKTASADTYREVLDHVDGFLQKHRFEVK
jgi:acetyl esterase/lipase